MRRELLLSFTALLISMTASSQSARADIVYSLTNLPSSQNGRTLTGSITTTGDISGIGDDNRLTESEILSWTFTVSGGSDPGTGGWVDSFTVSSSDSNAFIDLPSGTWATANEIAISDSNFLSFGVDDNLSTETSIAYKSAGAEKFYFANYLGNEDPNGWNIVNPSFPTAGGTGAWQIASVPEPSSAGLLLLLSAPALFKRRRRPLN